MVNKNYNTEPISKKFVLFSVVTLVVIIIYTFYPGESDRNDYQNFNEEPSYSDTSNVNSENSEQVQNENYEEKSRSEQYTEIKASTVDDFEQQRYQQTQYNQQQTYNNTNSNKSSSAYDNLLDELSKYPSKNENAIREMIDKILVYKGYPENTLNVSISNIAQSRMKSMNDYMIANLDLLTGDLNISKKLLNEYNIETIIAVLIREIDNFDKVAQVCKAIGIDDFSKIFTDSGNLFFNKKFWENASSFANIEGFDSKLYTEALRRFITQKNVGIQSPYADFYILSENMRNPIEISAYKEADYVFNHFKIPVLESDLKRITSAFNRIDWIIYTSSLNLPILQQERVAIFDYLFAKAIVRIFPEFQNEFKICTTQKFGNLTNFWNSFKTKFKDFYSHENVTKETISNILTVLNTTEKLARQGITEQEIEKALVFRINTLKENLISQEAVDNLKKTALNYLKYCKQANITDSKQELNAILLLICINNKLYKNNSSQISLNNITIPYELTELYNRENDNGKFTFIYNNLAFKETNLNMNDSNKLIYLLNSSRLKL